MPTILALTCHPQAPVRFVFPWSGAQGIPRLNDRRTQSAVGKFTTHLLGRQPPERLVGHSRL
jgi:hypothetical protein